MPKGNIKDRVDANVRWLERLSPEKQKQYERYFWMFVVGFMLLIAFSLGFFAGFERQCSYLVGQTEQRCNEYICDTYDVCMDDYKAEDIERLNISLPFIKK